MGQPVYHCSHQDLVPYDFSPSVKGQICGYDGGLEASPKREVVEEQFPRLLVARDISELIANDEVIFLEPEFELV